MTTRRTNSKTNRDNNVPYSNPPQSLEPQQLDERKEKWLCFNCDNKYSKGHKCSEKKFFYICCEEEEEKEHPPSQVEEVEEITPEEINPTIYCHAMARINIPQVLKIEGYIKKKKR